MTNATKFTFDTIFSEAGEILQEAPKPAKRSYLPKEVDEIREAAKAEGSRDAQAMADQAVAASLKQMAAVMESLFHVLDQEVENVRKEAAQLALAIGTKIAGRALEEYPTLEIEAIIDECLGNLRNEPHIYIEVHPDHAETIGARLQETLAGRTYRGEVHIEASNGLGETGLRVEWSNGGLERAPERLAAAIAKIVEQKWDITALPNGETDEPEQEIA